VALTTVAQLGNPKTQLTKSWAKGSSFLIASGFLNYACLHPGSRNWQQQAIADWIMLS
jgi:hypothetical protein